MIHDKNLTKTRFLFILLIFTLPVLANAQSFRLYGNNTHGFIPFNFPVNYTTKDSLKSHFSYSFMGTGMPFGHFEWVREIKSRYFLGVGLGYPHLAMVLGYKTEFLRTKELRFMFRGGSFPKFYNFSTNVSSSKTSKIKHSFTSSFHFTHGYIGDVDIITGLRSWFPGSKSISFCWNTKNAVTTTTALHFSLGYCFYGVLFDQCYNELIDVDWSSYHGCPDPKWKWERGWTAGIAIDHSF